MRVDVVHVGRDDAGVGQGGAQRTFQPGARRVGSGGVVGVGGGAEADDGGARAPAGHGVRPPFEHEDAGALPGDEPVAVDVERA